MPHAPFFIAFAFAFLDTRRFRYRHDDDAVYFRCRFIFTLRCHADAALHAFCFFSPPLFIIFFRFARHTAPLFTPFRLISSSIFAAYFL